MLVRAHTFNALSLYAKLTFLNTGRPLYVCTINSAINSTINSDSTLRRINSAINSNEQRTRDISMNTSTCNSVGHDTQQHSQNRVKQQASSN